MIEHGSGPALIVAPLAVLNNWMREFKKFAPDVPVCRYYGTQEEREELRSRHLSAALDDSGRLQPRRLPVFVTTFQIAMNDRRFLAPLRWSFLCVDEGHRMKNIASKLKQELTHYTSHEDGASGIIVTRLLLTGTPLQVISCPDFVTPPPLICVFQPQAGSPARKGNMAWCQNILARWRLACVRFVSCPFRRNDSLPCPERTCSFCVRVTFFSFLFLVIPQNNLDELWSLCNFVLPQVFSSLSMFQRWFKFDNLDDDGW